MADGFGLLQVKVLGRAFADASAAQLSQRAPGRGNHARPQAGTLGEIALQFVDQAQVQVPPLAGDFPQVIALLPSLQTVSGRVVVALLDRGGGFRARPRTQTPFVRIELLGDVVVELRARERRGRRQFRVAVDRFAPRL